MAVFTHDLRYTTKDGKVVAAAKLRPSNCCGAMELSNINVTVPFIGNTFRKPLITKSAVKRKYRKEILDGLSALITERMFKNKRYLLSCNAVDRPSLRIAISAYMLGVLGYNINAYTLCRHLKLKPGPKVINKNSGNTIVVYSGAPVYAEKK